MCKTWDLGQGSFFACICPVTSALFVERAVLFPLNCCYISVKKQLGIFMWVYFWVRCYVSLIYVSVFLPILQSWLPLLNIVSLNSHLILCFLFEIVLAFLVPFFIYINFRITFSASTKSLVWDFDGNYVKPSFQLGKIGVFIMLSLLIQEHVFF